MIRGPESLPKDCWPAPVRRASFSRAGPCGLSLDVPTPSTLIVARPPGARGPTLDVPSGVACSRYTCISRCARLLPYCYHIGQAASAQRSGRRRGHNPRWQSCPGPPALRIVGIRVSAGRHPRQRRCRCVAARWLARPYPSPAVSLPARDTPTALLRRGAWWGHAPHQPSLSPHPSACGDEQPLIQTRQGSMRSSFTRRGSLLHAIGKTDFTRQ